MKIAGKKVGLSTQIFAAMLLGAILGIVIGEPMTKVGFIGTIWLNCIKMIVVPMVLVTIVTGVVSQKDMKTLGRISFRIMAYYIITTLVACAIGILVTSIVKPGTIANFTGLASKEVTGSADITVADFFTGMFSSNIIQTFADGNILQTVVIAILLGVAILRMKNPRLSACGCHPYWLIDEWIRENGLSCIMKFQSGGPVATLLGFRTSVQGAYE